MGFGGLYISITGLQASKQSLNTVSHNISNSNNKNYVRQSALHATNPYTTIGVGRLEVGTGVNVAEIRQIRDEFLDLKLRREIASFGYHYAKSQILEDIEAVFNEITNSGLQKVMDDFWNNWNELYKEPESLTIRGLVHESSVAFVDTVNHISTQLNNIKMNLNNEILNKVHETNSILKRIGELNKEIKLVEGENSKIKANDFRDERNALLDRLAELMPVTSYENSFGEVIVHLKGKELVSGNFISTIDINLNNEGLANIYFYNTNEKIELNGLGELGGFIDARDESITYYTNRLDILVHTIASEINKLHSTGYDLLGTTGTDFFTGITSVENSAANIRVNPDLANFNMIAISSQPGVIGNGEIAKKIHELRKELLFGVYNPEDPFAGPGDLEMNIDDYYRDIVLSLGLEREASRTIANNQDFLIKSIDEKRKSISAVSLDEEMADMIKFQHSYVANSRVINAIDEMVENIVNRVGLVGR
ncbi:MAG: flagellar hook-associated protein FlgK [Tissierellia bacterium]|nr:flagellar hook-associated protein FlgK [Tissierellia bacterium]